MVKITVKTAKIAWKVAKSRENGNIIDTVFVVIFAVFPQFRLFNSRVRLFSRYIEHFPHDFGRFPAISTVSPAISDVLTPVTCLYRLVTCLTGYWVPGISLEPGPVADHSL